MAVEMGVSAGFVTTAPTANPTGSDIGIDTFAASFKIIAPANITAVTELGWYASNSSQAATYHIGIYSHNEADNEPEDLLVSDTAAKGTTAGWKKTAVNFEGLVAGNTYWIAVQLDNTATQTKIDSLTDTTIRYALLYPTQTELPDPWGVSDEIGGEAAASQVKAIYALYETVKTEVNVNIEDVWKNVARIKLNRLDDWKTVVSIQLNIGDTWKIVY